LVVRHPAGVVVSGNVRAGSNCTLMQGVTLGEEPGRSGSQAASIGDGVFIGPGAVVLGNVEVGSFAVIGANAVVRANVPAGNLAVGVPARARPRTRSEAPTDGAGS
jgi:serine O-acetyltransferase